MRKETERLEEIPYSMETTLDWGKQLLEVLKKRNGQRGLGAIVVTRSKELSNWWKRKFQKLEEEFIKAGKVNSLGILALAGLESNLRSQADDNIFLNHDGERRITTFKILPKNSNLRHVEATFVNYPMYRGLQLARLFAISYRYEQGNQELMEKSIEINFDTRNQLIHKIAICTKPTNSKGSIEDTFTFSEVLERPKSYHPEDH